MVLLHQRVDHNSWDCSNNYHTATTLSSTIYLRLQLKLQKKYILYVEQYISLSLIITRSSAIYAPF